MERQTPSWLSYCMSGFLAVMLSWTLSACRLGNRVSETPEPDRLPDFSGYYNTEAILSEHCRFIDGQEPVESDCTVYDQAAEIPDKVPHILRPVLTNPVAFLEVSLISGESFLYDPKNENPPALATVFKAPNQISDGGYVNLTGQWEDNQCETYFFLIHKGFLYQGENAGPIEIDPDFDVVGRLSLEMTVAYLFLPRSETQSCVPLQNQLRDCYLDADDCNGGDPVTNGLLHDEVVEELGPIVDSGRLNINELPGILELDLTTWYN